MLEGLGQGEQGVCQGACGRCTNAMLGGCKAGQDRSCSRQGPGSSSEGPQKARALFRKAVHYRARVSPIASLAKAIRAQGVHHDQEHIGMLVVGWLSFYQSGQMHLQASEAQGGEVLGAVVPDRFEGDHARLRWQGHREFLPLALGLGSLRGAGDAGLVQQVVIHPNAAGHLSSLPGLMVWSKPYEHLAARWSLWQGQLHQGVSLQDQRRACSPRAQAQPRGL